MFAAKLLTLAVTLLAPVAAHPVYIGCDLTIMTAKPGAGENVMTTTGNFPMGATPVDDATLGVPSTMTYTAGSTVTISFGSAFEKGLVHATAGTFSDPGSEFGGVADSSAATCTGTNQIKYKNTKSATADIVWTAPADVAALDSVTLSFMGAGGYGATKKRVVTLTKAAVATTTTIAAGAGAATTTTVAGAAAATTTTVAGATTTMAATTMAMTTTNVCSGHDCKTCVAATTMAATVTTMAAVAGTTTMAAMAGTTTTAAMAATTTTTMAATTTTAAVATTTMATMAATTTAAMVMDCCAACAAAPGATTGNALTTGALASAKFHVGTLLTVAMFFMLSQFKAL